MRNRLSQDTISRIIDMRSSAKGYKIIAKELGINRDTVRSTCIRYGCSGTLGVYVHKRKPIINSYTPKPRVCDCCGKEFIQKYGRKYCSDECRKNAKTEHDHKRIIESKALHEERNCPECGVVFITSRANNKFCSTKCAKRYHDRPKKHRDKRLAKEQIVDMDISLQALIFRDSNKCHICGGECDLYDYWFDDRKKMVCGNSYPSVDHIIPIARGGTHSWDNVRLAHRRCNSIKGDKLCRNEQKKS